MYGGVEMRKITFAFLSMLLITPCMANIHINPDVVKEVVAKHFPNKQTECISEYVAQVMASNGAGIAASKLWNVCAAGGLDIIKQPADKEKCSTFVKELTSKATIKFYAACGKDKSMTGAVCVYDFATLVVNMQQAQGLAKLYARNKSDNIIQCKTKPRMDVQTFNSINIHAMGMSSTTYTPYVQCTSLNSNKFYEFRFSNVDGNIDATNHKNFKTGICKIFGYKYVSKKPEAPADNHKFDICDGIKYESACNKLNQVISAGNIGYVASWGPLGYKTGRTGYQITGRNFPYCVLSENVAKDKDGHLLGEKTAFGLDGRVFLNAGVQRKGSNEIKQQIRTYVENTMGKGNVKSFSCEETYHTIKLKGRSGTDDMVRCTINDQVVEFFFDDLSESWGTYNKSGHEAMNCIAWGGTFTGKKCIGLDEKMCYKVRDANAQSCPECKKIQWNSKTKICELPASVSATNLKRGLTYSAIVGGAVVGVVITVGTMGAATAPTALILTGLAVETLGAGIELKAQVDIDRTADKFFTQSANCHDAQCAEDLIVEYLKKMSNQQNDMLEEELSAADAELARLADLIPEESDFYQRMFGNGTDLASNETGEWTAAQVWRAVGIGMQSISVLTGVGKWIIKKSPALQKGLQRTTIVFGKKGKILRNARKVALANVVDYDKLDDVGKEWYKLWKQYAPNNQTFDEFKAMANGNLDEMKQMVKNWDGLGKGAAYSTYDPKMSKAFKDFEAKEEELKQWWYDELDKAYQKYLNNGATGDFYKSDEYAQLVKQYYKKDDEARESIPTQWQIAQEFQLKNLANVVDERVAVFDDVLASNPEISSKLQPNNWRRLTNQEKTAVVQQLVDEYATKLGTPKAEIIIKKIRWDWGGYYTPGTNKITLNSRHLNEASLKSILSHEYGHLVDHLDPNAGALGSQYSYYGNKIYSNKRSKGYRVALTEQSSFAIGDATDKGEAAINSAATAIIGTSAGAGVEIGVANSILEKQKDKK